MTSTRHPLIDLVYNDETGRYIGMLERKLLKLQLDDLKMRTLLELLTDQSWDDYQFADEDEQIRRLAEDALQRRLGLNQTDARNLVQERFTRHNTAPVPEEMKTYLVGPTQPSKQHMATRARPIERTGGGYDVDKHLRGLRISRDHMQGET